jgi:transcriptional regulator with GAF, ATPase, and Fis domain
MNTLMGWGAEGISSPRGVQTSLRVREAALESRIEALREAALNILTEVESLRSAPALRVDGNVKLHDEVQQFETDLIRATLDRTNGNQTRAAQLLGLKLTTLNTKIKRYNISFAGHDSGAESDMQEQQNAA